LQGTQDFSLRLQLIHIRQNRVPARSRAGHCSYPEVHILNNAQSFWIVSSLFTINETQNRFFEIGGHMYMMVVMIMSCMIMFGVTFMIHHSLNLQV